MATEEIETKERIAQLQRALKNPALSGIISPLIAASFGAIPIARAGRRITLATFARANPKAAGLLGKVLDAEIEAVPFPDELMYSYLGLIYLKDGTVNYNTFQEEEFLREDRLDGLLNEKVDRTSEPGVKIPPDQVAVLDYSFRSRLRNLDGGRLDVSFTAAEDEPHVRFEQGVPVICSGDALEDETALVIQRSFRFDGDNANVHGFASERAGHLPYFVYPTEMQLVRIEADGALRVYVYDREETLPPGEARDWRLHWHYLSYGQRYRRDVRVRVNAYWVGRRAAVQVRKGGPFGPDDLRRWFGEDLQLD